MVSAISQLYMNELNQVNVALSRKIFKWIDPNASPNIFKGDFLAQENIGGVEKFDIIIGNPPFNASQEYTNKKGGGDSLWPKFVIKSLALLKTDSYLNFVHPSSWRKPESESSKTSGLFNEMAHNNHLIYLEIHDTSDGNKIFGVGTRYDWYVIKKQKNNSITEIKDQQGIMHKINLNDWNFLPNSNIELIKTLLSDKMEDYVIYSRNQFGTDKPWTSETKIADFSYPLINSTPSTGPRYYFSSTKTPEVNNFIPMFGIKKVIFGESGINDVIIDESGKYGLTQGAIGLKIHNETDGNMLKVALESDKFKTVLNAMSFGNFRIDWRMFKYFKPDFYKRFLNSSHSENESTSKPSPKQTRKRKPNQKQKGGNKYTRKSFLNWW